MTLFNQQTRLVVGKIFNDSSIFIELQISLSFANTAWGSS